MEEQREKLGLPNQKGLIIWDAFNGQKTSPVLEEVRDNDILMEYVPTNMTEYYQPLDLTTNKWAKDYLKNRFIVRGY